MLTAQAIEQDVLESIDYDVVSEEGVFPNMAWEFCAGARMYSTVIAYNSEAASDGSHPKNVGRVLGYG